MVEMQVCNVGHWNNNCNNEHHEKLLATGYKVSAGDIHCCNMQTLQALARHPYLMVTKNL